MEKSIKRNKSRQFWVGHVNAWSDSDLSQAEYCRQHNLPWVTFITGNSNSNPKLLFLSSCNQTVSPPLNSHAHLPLKSLLLINSTADFPET